MKTNNLFRIFYEHKGQVWHTVVTGKTPEDARAKFGRMHPHVKDLGFFQPLAYGPGKTLTEDRLPHQMLMEGVA
jgi:hypothetical protein